jgi:hypothetical protein
MHIHLQLPAAKLSTATKSSTYHCTADKVKFMGSCDCRQLLVRGEIDPAKNSRYSE